MIGTYFGYFSWKYPSDWLKIPYNLYREIKSFYHRGMYGYAENDLWNLDDYLADWLSSALKELKDKSVHWDKINLNLIIRGFEAYKELDHEEDIEKSKSLQKEVKEGLQHFADNFGGFWW